MTTNDETKATTEDSTNETNQTENTDDSVQIEDSPTEEDKQIIDNMVNPIAIKVMEKTMKKLLERNIDIKSIDQDIIAENIADFIIDLTLPKDNVPENQDSHMPDFNIDTDKLTSQVIESFETLAL